MMSASPVSSSQRVTVWHPPPGVGPCSRCSWRMDVLVWQPAALHARVRRVAPRRGGARCPTVPRQMTRHPSRSRAFYDVGLPWRPAPHADSRAVAARESPNTSSPEATRSGLVLPPHPSRGRGRNTGAAPASINTPSRRPDPKPPPLRSVSVSHPEQLVHRTQRSTSSNPSLRRSRSPGKQQSSTD
jgi:hypothetical protein